MKINFLFCETDRKSINLDVLFYAEQGARTGRENGYSCSCWSGHILSLAGLTASEGNGWGVSGRWINCKNLLEDTNCFQGTDIKLTLENWSIECFCGWSSLLSIFIAFSLLHVLFVWLTSQMLVSVCNLSVVPSVAFLIHIYHEINKAAHTMQYAK